MRNMSFSLTTAQIRAGTKIVTRRDGWWFLKAGDVVMAVEKGMGLKKGEQVVRIRPLRILAAHGEKLGDLLTRHAYARNEMRYEGFPDKQPADFVAMLCALHHCTPEKVFNRIVFEYVKEPA